MSDELKPCPFCNLQPLPSYTDGRTWRISCTACLMKGPERSTPEKAIESWNRRPASEQAREEVVEAAKDLDAKMGIPGITSQDLKTTMRVEAQKRLRAALSRLASLTAKGTKEGTK